MPVTRKEPGFRPVRRKVQRIAASHKRTSVVPASIEARSGEGADATDHEKFVASDMFERVISQTIQQIAHDVLRERSLISLIDILEDERIPARLKPFFATEVQWWLYNESLARAANRRFDYEQPELASLLNYLEQVQFKYARFEREEFLAVLDSAVKLTYNYLCRPQTTLKWYIFRGQPVKPLREVMLRFDAVSDYEYFRTVFIEWVESKQNERATFDAISATEFERVIRRTDDQILLNCTVEDLLAIMSPLFEFIGEGEAQRVPVDALVIFFDDKNIKRLVDFLEGYRDRGHEYTTREEFVLLLDELLSVADDAPETDFSQVYQNDELDDVVRRHLGNGPDEGVFEEGAPLADYHIPEYAPAEPAYSAAVAEDPAPPQEHPLPDVAQFEHGSVAAEEGEPIPYASVDRFLDDAERNDRQGPPAPMLVVESALPGPVDPETIPLEHVGPVSLPSDELPDLVRWDRVEDAHADLPGISGLVGIAEALSAPHAAEPEPASALSESVREEIWHEETGADSHHHGSPVIPSLMMDAETIDRHKESSAVEQAQPAPAIEEPRISVPPPASQAFAGPAAQPLSARFDAGAIAERPVPVGAVAPPEKSAEQFADVRRYIDSSLERKVIKKIFAKNKTEYDQAIQKLNAAENWRVASQILDELFIRFDVDPYSRTAVRFTDSVYGRYLSRGE